MQSLHHIGASINQMLILNREVRSGRMIVIIVKEPVGF